MGGGMNFHEVALRFSCDDAWLYGIATVPENCVARGVVIVVGGPQYRVGSHRQFVLLARYLASRGIPVMRFDYRGMGDAEGEQKTFEDVNDDIRAAINVFMEKIHALKEVVIWGLCDAASAALFYAYQDPRVTGLVLLNPWVRTEQGIAKTYLKHYYRERLFDKAFWGKIISGRFNYMVAARSAFALIGEALFRKRSEPKSERENKKKLLLPDQMRESFRRFNGKVLLILSGDDLTAKEFCEVTASSPDWRELLDASRVQRYNLAGANHTFSHREWRDQVATWTGDWMQTW